MKNLITFWIISALLISNAILIKAADDKHFKSIAKPSKLIVKAGEEFAIQLTLTVDKGWHIYELNKKLADDYVGPILTEISFNPDNFIKLEGKIKATPPKVKYDSAFSMKIGTYYGQAIFEIPLKASKDIDFNSSKIQIVLYTQQCTETSCLPPTDFKINISKEIFKSEAALNLTESVQSSPTATTVKDEKSIQTTQKAIIGNQVQKTESQEQSIEMQKRGFWSYIWFAMLQGALSLLTPCVFPMIPITVSFFTKRSEKKKSKGLVDSLVYALGIMFTFTGIGVIFAGIYGPSGIQDLATNPWLNLGIATIFIVFALNLFGAFEIQLPTSVLNKLNSKSQGSGIISVLLMGLTFSLTSFTCTVPFVGTTLVSVGSGEWFYPIAGMLAFSAVFAAPFFLLALFPSALNRVPRAGGWMNNIKVVMGFLEIAAAIKFLSNADLVWMWGVLPRELFLSIWLACTVMIILYILGIFRLHHDAPVDSIGTPRVVFAVIFAAITFYLLIGLNGKPLGELDAFLPPPNYNELMSTKQSGSTTAVTSNSTSAKSIPTSKDELVWMDNYQEALKLAKEKKKMLFIDFTGFTCTNCRWMELNMFSKKEIRSYLENMILVRLYTDRRNEPYQSNKNFQKNRFNSIELPLYVIYTPEEKLIGTKAFTRDASEFLGFLKKGVDYKL